MLIGAFLLLLVFWSLATILQFFLRKPSYETPEIVAKYLGKSVVYNDEVWKVVNIMRGSKTVFVNLENLKTRWTETLVPIDCLDEILEGDSNE